ELSTTVSQRVRARIELSQQLVIRGELDAAVEQARLAVEEAENGDDTDLVIEACLEHGVAAGTHGRLDAKEYILTRLEPRLATSDNAMFYARWLYELGWIKRRRAQHREAQRLLRQAFDRFQALDDLVNSVRTCNILGLSLR